MFKLKINSVSKMKRNRPDFHDIMKISAMPTNLYDLSICIKSNTYEISIFQIMKSSNNLIISKYSILELARCLQQRKIFNSENL